FASCPAFICCLSFFCPAIMTLALFTLFPYTTLFRSARPSRGAGRGSARAPLRRPALALPPFALLRQVLLRPELARPMLPPPRRRSEEHTSELQSREKLVCRLLLEKKNYATHSMLSRV